MCECVWFVWIFFGFPRWCVCALFFFLGCISSCLITWIHCEHRCIRALNFSTSLILDFYTHNTSLEQSENRSIIFSFVFFLFSSAYNTRNCNIIDQLVVFFVAIVKLMILIIRRIRKLLNSLFLRIRGNKRHWPNKVFPADDDWWCLSDRKIILERKIEFENDYIRKTGDGIGSQKNVYPIMQIHVTIPC